MLSKANKIKDDITKSQIEDPPKKAAPKRKYEKLVDNMEQEEA